MPAKLFAVLAVAIVALGAVWLLGLLSDPAPVLDSPTVASDRQTGQKPVLDPAQANAGLEDAANRPAEQSGGERRQIQAPAEEPALDKPLVLTGRLVDRDGQPLSGLDVRLSSYSMDRIEGPGSTNRSSAPGGSKDSSDAEGRFALEVGRGHRGHVRLAESGRIFREGMKDFTPVYQDRDLGDLEVLRESVVQGVVQDATGKPVADVRITASRDRIGLGGMSSSVTGANGEFEVGMLHPGSWYLRTTSDKYLPVSLPIEVAPEERLEGLLISVAEGKTISGRVIDDRGQPVAGIKVGTRRRVEQDGMQIERFIPEEAARTDADGMFTLAGLAADRVVVIAFGTGYSRAQQGDVAVGTADLVLRVNRLGSIHGILRDLAGEPIAGSRVFAESAERARPAGGFGIGGFEQFRDGAVVTAADGSFAIEDVKPGLVVVRARGASHRAANSQPVSVQPAVATEDVVIVADRGASLRATVVDTRGEPVVGAAVWVEEPPSVSDSSFQVRRHVEISDDEGSAVPGASADNVTDAHGVVMLYGLSAGELLVKAVHDAFAPARPARVIVPAAGVVEVSLALRVPGWADFSVMGEDGKPVAARIAVNGPVGNDIDDDTHELAADANGQARLGPLVAGNYEAVLELEPKQQAMAGGMMLIGDEGQPLPATRVPFRIVAGDSVTVAMRMPLLTRLSGRITDQDGPVAGVVVELERLDDEPDAAGGVPSFSVPSARSKDDGSYELTDLSAGKYELRWGKPSQLIKASMPLLIPVSTPEVERDLQLRYGRLRVRVTDEDGEPIEKATVELRRGGPRDGDEGGRPRLRRRMMSISIVSDGSDSGEMTSMTMGGSPSAKTDIDGIAEIEDVPPGTYTIVASRDGYVSNRLPEQTVAEGSTLDAGTIELSVAGRIRGTVVDEEGNAVGMAIVRCRSIDNPDGEPISPATAMGGAFSFNSLSAGRYALRASVIGPSAGSQGAEVELVVERGRSAKTQLVAPGN